MMGFNTLIDEMKKTLLANPVHIFLISLVGMGIVIILAIIFSSAKFGELIPYWIYYKPCYTLFKNCIYLPFYLYCVGIFFIICIFPILILKFVIKKVCYKMIFVSIISLIIIIVSQNIYKDIIIIIDGKYEVIECNYNSLNRRTNNKNNRMSVHYEINSNERNNEKRYIYIQMDFYQYNELLKSKEKNKIIRVYYLPNTRRMLKHE